MTDGPINVVSAKNVTAQVDEVMTFALPEVLGCGLAPMYCLPRAFIFPEVSIKASACRQGLLVRSSIRNLR